ncbi:MAG: hypothetical protein GC184_05585 [Rhizobiales bacterium]|nr:hypothetical protein [Hyphomicrobiales bacterium]
MPRIAVIHLVRFGNPAALLKAFLASYDAHPAGMAHDLVFVFKGFPAAERTKLEIGMKSRLDHTQFIPVSDEGYDINAYRHAAGLLSHDIVVFTNSHSVIEADNWLALLLTPLLTLPDAGLVGATGNWERPHPAMPFPNAHIRSNGFALRREKFLSLNFGPLDSKEASGRFENGEASMTRQIRAQGDEVYIVGRNGQAYAEADWPKSNIFRSGHQENLLISDNRTRDYHYGSNKRRTKLARLSWGEEASPPPNSLGNRLKGIWKGTKL